MKIPWSEALLLGVAVCGFLDVVSGKGKSGSTFSQKLNFPIEKLRNRERDNLGRGENNSTDNLTGGDSD